MNIVGKDGFSVKGLDLPRGTLVKWIRTKEWWDDMKGEQISLTLVRHTAIPLPERMWERALNYDETKSFMTIGEYGGYDSVADVITAASKGPIELEPFYTPFVTSRAVC